MDPQIISSYDGGKHNADLEKTMNRLEKAAAYKDLSTIMIVPAFGMVPTKAVASWLNMFAPPNQKFVRIFAVGMEVGDAYTRCVEAILAHPDLSKFKYILTMEHDNIPPADGLVNLLASMEAHPELACIGGLYYTKGEGGQPQIWGNPNEHPINFKPCRPDPNGGLVECCGTGMGFNVFRLDMFKDERLRRPWFKTVSNVKEGIGTQDLYFWGDARKHGFRCAIDCNVKVGHYDVQNDFVW